MKRCDCHTGTILCAECGGVVAVARRRPKKKLAPGKSKAERKAERNERAAKIREEVFDRWGGSCALCVNGTTLSTTMAATELHHLENAPAAYRRMREIERVLEAVKEGVKAYARQTPIELEPGVIYGPKPRTTESIVADVARPALVAAFDEQFAQDAVEQEATKSALDRAIRRYRERTGDRTSLKDLASKALDAIRQCGGVKKATTYIVTEHETKGKAA